MPEAINRLSDTPGMAAHGIWDTFSGNGGLYIVAGREGSGKSTFVDRIALEANGYLHPGEPILRLQTSYANQHDPGTLVLNRVYVPYGTSITQKEKLRQEWLDEVVSEVCHQDPKIVVIDEILDEDTIRLSVELYVQGFIVFAVFPAYSSGEIIPGFARALKGSELSRKAAEKSVHMALHDKIFIRDDGGNVIHKGVVSYDAGTLDIS